MPFISKVLSKVSVNKLNIVPQRSVLERCQGAATGKIKSNKLITVNQFKVSWKIKLKRIINKDTTQYKNGRANSLSRA